MTRFELATSLLRNGHQKSEISGQKSGTPLVRTEREWPLILQPMKLWAQDGDQGLGDIIERTIGPLGGEEFKKWFKVMFGRDCNCNARKESWNIRYPL